MKNTLKIVFLGIIGFGLLVYLTAPKNEIKKSENIKATLETIPRYFDVVGDNPYTKLQSLFKKGEEKYIVVLNHDALVVFKDLYKKTDKNIILVANISKTPWIVKQIAVNGELEKMYKGSKIPLINDSDGNFVNVLGLKNDKQNRYFVFKLMADGNITQIFEGSVKENALEKGLSSSEFEDSLNELVKVFN